MTLKLIVTAFAISAGFSGVAFAQDGQPTTTPPTVPAPPALPAALGATVPATNLLIVGGVIAATAGVIAAGADSTDGTTSTTSTN